MAYDTEDSQTTRDWTLATDEELRCGYEEMAADKEREAEALAWSEALIGDGFDPR
jgi:hypothetical protein